MSFANDNRGPARSASETITARDVARLIGLAVALTILAAMIGAWAW